MPYFEKYFCNFQMQGHTIFKIDYLGIELTLYDVPQ